MEIGHQARIILPLCSEVFQQVYFLCKGLNLFGSSEVYHIGDILTNVSLLLNSYIELEHNERVCIYDIIINDLAAAYRIKIRDCIMNDKSSVCGFIHGHLNIIDAIIKFTIRHISTLHLNYKGWNELVCLVFGKCNSLYDNIKQYLPPYRDETVKSIEDYIKTNKLIDNSKQLLKNDYDNKMNNYLGFAF